MNANKSGICKIEKCNKLQVRDGYCKQCGEYYLQKEIMTKLNTVGDELARIQGNSPQPVIESSNTESALIGIIASQTQLLQGIITGLDDLKDTIKNAPSQPTQIVKEVIKEKSNISSSSFTAIDDDIFIPSGNSIDVQGDIQIVDDKRETVNTKKDINSIANKLNLLNR